MLLIPAYEASAANPNLFVSAENPAFGNRFAGSMVVEVVISDSRLTDIDSAQGEPSVTVNGHDLRMAQTTSGSWVAYFANAGAARAADSTVGLAGTGLDFGVFCSSGTPAETFGVSFSDLVAVPRSGNLTGFADGSGSAGACTGSAVGTNFNNVVRSAKSLNTNPAVPPGQIGLDPGAWPLIQLFSFSSATVRYEIPGSPQEVVLGYDDIPNITLERDRETYPAGAEVFVTINDAQLNQDPTDEDSWTFGSGSVFYRAYDDRGSAQAAGGPGLVNIASRLSQIGFDDNGRLDVELGGVLEYRTNGIQPALSVTDGSATYSDVITFVETGRNTGVFDATDSSKKSVLGIAPAAQRGLGGHLEYNDKKTGILTASSTATLGIEPSLSVGFLSPGNRSPVTLSDPDQNLSSDVRNTLDVSNPASIIPTLKIGSPATIAGSGSAQFYTDSGQTVSASVSAPDRHSERLFIDTAGVSGAFDGVSIETGLSASQIAAALINPSQSGSDGTSWLNYHIGSLGSYQDAAISLEFGSTQIPLAGTGLGQKGLVQLDSATVSQIASQSGNARLVIDMPIRADGSGQLPIAADFVSFGASGSRDVNNAIYRFELEETSGDSSTFEGTIEYSVANQLNFLDPGFFGGASTFGDRIKFVISGGIDDLFISYSDIDAVGVRTTVSSQSSADTHSGSVSLNSGSFRFGQAVTITLNDPDLNLKHDVRDIYPAVTDPSSEIVDTVGNNGIILLEVLLKDIRYKRCTIDGTTHGGLASSGFSMVETGPSTGIFEGSFTMPSQICNRDSTALISPAGGSVDVRYYDAHDSSGSPRTVKHLEQRQVPVPRDVAPQLSSSEVIRPPPGETKEITVSGVLGASTAGTKLNVMITGPGGKSEEFQSSIIDGRYKSAISINQYSEPGPYTIDLSYVGSRVGTLTFEVSLPDIPESAKTDARMWSAGLASDDDFAGSIRALVESGTVTGSDSEGEAVPEWFKSGAKLWADGQISDDEYVDMIQYLVKKGIIKV